MANKLLERKKKIIGICLIVVLAIILVSLIVWWLVSDDESESECIRPSNTTGYNNITETNLSMGSEFDVSVGCSSGYTGTANATACSVAGQAYTLSGCSVAQSPGSGSTNPCSLSTLTQPTNGSWGTTCSSNSGEIQHGASCDLSCNTGYTPSNQPQCNNGVLSSTTLTCTANAVEAGTCIRPTDTAYDFSGATETLTMGVGFGVTGITCNDGYGPGTDILASVCDSANTAYNLTGCSDIDECVNNPCGSGATCTNNDGGYTCGDEYTWVFSDSGQNCTNACVAASSSLTCTDGEWGVNSESIFREKMSAAGQSETAAGPPVTQQPCGEFPTGVQYSSIRPFTRNNQASGLVECYPSAGGETQRCTGSSGQGRRLCRCS